MNLKNLFSATKIRYARPAAPRQRQANRCVIENGTTFNRSQHTNRNPDCGRKNHRQELSDKDTSCFSRFAQKDFKITFVAWIGNRPTN